MISALVSFTGLFSAVVCLLTGVGLLGTLLSLRMVAAGFSSQAIGMIMAAYYAGLVAGSFVSQRLILRVGHIRAFAAFAAVATAIVMLHGLYVSAVFWGVLRLLFGMATIGLYMVIESWLNDRTTSQRRGRVFSLYMVLSYLGMGAGQVLLTVSDIDSLEPFLLTGILLSGCLVPVAVTGSVQPQLPPTVRYGFVGLFLKSPLGLLGALSAGLINGSVYAMGPVFSSQIGQTTSETAWLMSAAIFGGLMLQWPIGVLSDRVDRTVVLSVVASLVAAGSLAMAWVGSYRIDWILPGMVVFGGLIFSIYPVAVARAYDLFAGEDIVAVSSALLLAYGIGAALGPIGSSLTMTAIDSPKGLFLFCAGVGVVYAAATVYSRGRKKIEIVPVEDQVGFMPMKSVSPVAAQIDPRAEGNEEAM